MASREILDRVTALLEATQRVEFHIPEDTGFFRLDDALVGHIRGLIDQATTLLREIATFYEELAPREVEIAADDDTDFLRAIGAEISSELAGREIANLAFIARAQLLELAQALGTAVERKELWMIASQADAGLRRAGKSLIAVEAAIREYEGLPVQNRYWSDVRDSLDTRRLYGQFRRAVQGRDRARGERSNLREHMRRVANRIAILRDLAIYPFLRIDDRLQIRSLQKRIQSWLQGEEAATEAAGERLWQDIVAFANLLHQINNREELRDHDRRAVSEAYRILFESGEIPERIHAHRLTLLEPLFGRDDELDDILSEPDRHRAEDLREPLERLMRSLDRPFAASHPGHPLR